MSPKHAVAAALMAVAVTSHPVLAQSGAATRDQPSTTAPAGTGANSAVGAAPNTESQTTAPPGKQTSDPGMSSTAGSPGSETMPGSAGQNTATERR